MDITATHDSANLIVSVEGGVDGANAMAFQTVLDSAIQPNDHGALMDVENLRHTGSAGLNVILRVAKAVRKQNAKLVGCSLAGSVRGIFAISGFDRIVSLFDSQADALQRLATRGVAPLNTLLLGSR